MLARHSICEGGSNVEVKYNKAITSSLKIPDIGGGYWRKKS